MIVGETVRIDAAWTAGGTADNPGSVAAFAKDPSGNISSLSVTHDSTGADHVELPLTAEGRWWVRFEGTSPVPTAAETAIDVEDSHFS